MEQSVSKAMQLHQAGKLREAAHMYENILKKEPNNAEALHLMGLLHFQTGNHSSSERLIKKSLTLSERNAEAHCNLGTILREKGKLDEAVKHYREAISLKPDFAMPHNRLGSVLQEQGKLDEAIEHYRQSISLEPGSAMAYNNLGAALLEQNRLDEAIQYCRKAISLKPDFPMPYNNLGKARQEQGELDEAIEKYRKAISLQPGFAMAYNNLGAALLEQNRLDEAIANFRMAISSRADFELAHFNLGCALLVGGSFQEGWEEYEWRLKLPSARCVQTDKPLWRGESIDNGTVLVHREQGLGDTIQFVRYLPLVKHRVGKVILECQPSLRRLFVTLDGVDKLLSSNDDEVINERYDYHIHLMSLPRVFKTRIDNVPALSPYIFPEKVLVRRAERVFDSYGDKYRIGIVWRGNPKNRKDRTRSCELEDFFPLLRVLHVQLFSLQKEGGTIPREYRHKIVDLGPFLNTLADTASIIAHLDLVISVDTLVAHLAGAMAKPVWTLIPFAPEWRWMLNRNDSPWYPSMKLFRQAETGNWKDVFKRIQETLEFDNSCRPMRRHSMVK